MIILTEKEAEVSFFKYFILWPCSLWNLSFPNQDSNLHPLHWTCRALTTGLPGKSLPKLFLIHVSYLSLSLPNGVWIVEAEQEEKEGDFLAVFQLSGVAGMD